MLAATPSLMLLLMLVLMLKLYSIQNRLYDFPKAAINPNMASRKAKLAPKEAHESIVDADVDSATAAAAASAVNGRS
jgi:hypothetical protein